MCLQGSWSQYHWCLDWGALYIEAAKQCPWSLTTRYSPSGCDCHTISDITNWFCTCQSKVVPSCPLLGLHMRKLPAVCADLTIIRSLPSLYKVSVSIQVTRTVCYANWVSKIRSGGRLYRKPALKGQSPSQENEICESKDESWLPKSTSEFCELLLVVSERKASMIKNV